MALRSLTIKGGRFIWKTGEVGIMLRSADGEVGRDVQRRAYAVQKRMKRLVVVRTGELIRGIHVKSAQESSQGPISRVISDAPHTLVNELGRRAVRASGTYAKRSNLRTRAPGSQLAKGRLVWGSDSSVSSNRLAFPNQAGVMIYPRSAGPADGSHFMERSIDAADD